MNAEETGKILGLAALVDNRKVDVPVIVAWHQMIGDLPYADAEQAVRDHYATSRERIMPADIRERVSVVRSERLRINPVPAPPAEILDDPVAYRAALRESTQAILDGPDDDRRAIGSGS